jgi:hypothetical protein
MFGGLRRVLVICLLATVVVQGQTPSRSPSGSKRDNPPQKPGTARVAGRVLAADTGKPLRRAIVRASVPATREPRWIWTDADGRWQLDHLPAGRYTLTVSKSGYLSLEYGQLRPFEPGKVLELAEEQVLEKVDISLPKGGVIAGRIHDEFGDPVSAALVRAMRYRYADGQRRMAPLIEGIDAMLAGGVTDDIGQYRLHGLPPGDYFVQALIGAPTIPSSASDDRTGYAPSFYPGTASVTEAQRVTIAIGQEAQSVNFSVVPIRYATVSGRAVNSTGGPIATSSISLSTAAPNVILMNQKATVTLDGTFTIPGVAPGDYHLRVATSHNGVREFASLGIAVSGQDVGGLAVVTAPGASASGRVRMEGNAVERPRMSIATFPSAPSAEDTHSASSAVRADGIFELVGLSGRQVFRLANPVSDWFLKSVTLDGRDITESGYAFVPGEKVSGIDIVLTQRVTALSGTVQDDRGRPIGDYTVVAFPQDSSKWVYRTRSIRAARPDQDGKFLLKGLPPDEYRVVAVEYIEAGEETDPERLEKWKASGTRLTLAEYEAKSVTLKLTR